MKRLLSISMLMVSLSIAFAGCSSSSTSTPSATQTPSPSATTTATPTPSPSPTGLNFQDFEDSSDPGFNASWTGYLWEKNNGAALAHSNEYARSGYAVKFTAPDRNPNGFAIYGKSWDFDFVPTTNSNLSFWVYAVTTDTNWLGVNVIIEDTSSVTVKKWSTGTGQYFNPGHWAEITMPLSIFNGVDLSHVKTVSIEFTNQGVYYIDDVRVK